MFLMRDHSLAPQKAPKQSFFIFSRKSFLSRPGKIRNPVDVYLKLWKYFDLRHFHMLKICARRNPQIFNMIYHVMKTKSIPQRFEASFLLGL